MPDDILHKVTEFLSKKKPWYELPTTLAVPKLIEMRNELRQKNLHDTEEPPLRVRPDGEPVPAEAQHARTVDGDYNDLHQPRMGASGARFGRNFPLDKTFPDTKNLMNPNPREVSRTLLTRNEFQPATILNLLAAAWIQFMVHDWFVHKKSEKKKLEIPIAADDNFPEKPMTIAATEPEPAPAGSTHPPAYANPNSHWWDASQIYGCDTKNCDNVRTHKDGKLKIGDDGRLMLDAITGAEITGFGDNIWIGLSMLHALFVREHNSVCDMLKQKNPTWNDQQLFDKARLVTSALMAKIHTVEWTPAILPNPTTKLAMHTNWYGLSGDELQDVLKFLNESELLGGIPGSKTDHHTAPYSLTEEFVSVYRMHALIPDDFEFRSAATDEVIGRATLPEVSGAAGRKLLPKYSDVDLFYSFGRMYPGAVRLHNYPKHLQDLTRDTGERFDLGAVDILRDRERGVPRYNEFRRQLRKDPVKSFEELTDNPTWREELRKVYNNDIEMVDLMVGLYAEPLPAGFGFSETAFRIFVLMASRRLKSDRFFTNDFNADTYSKEGIEWIQKNGMADVIKRHVPDVAFALAGVENPFAPWHAKASAPVAKVAGHAG